MMCPNHNRHIILSYYIVEIQRTLFNRNRTEIISGYDIVRRTDG